MVRVKTNKRISRHIFKNTIGQIKKADLKNYGVGKSLMSLHKIEVEIDGERQFILNKNLELIEKN